MAMGMQGPFAVQPTHESWAMAQQGFDVCYDSCKAYMVEWLESFCDYIQPFLFPHTLYKY